LVFAGVAMERAQPCPLISFPLLVLDWGMILHLRKQRAQQIIEGRNPGLALEDDYAVVECSVIGRIYKERQLEGVKWQWSLEVNGVEPISGTTNTLKEAKAEIAEAYERAKGR